MNRFQIWWIHLKLGWLGDKRFEKKGGGIIPCRHCGRLFRSYCHYSSDFGDCYDDLCDDCVFKTKNLLEVKRVVEQILTDYNSKVKDWDTAKAYLWAEGFNIRYTPHRCAWMECELKGNEPTLAQITREAGLDSWGYYHARHLLADHNFKPTDRLCKRCFKIPV